MSTDGSESATRRGFLRTATGAAAVGATGTASAQETTEDGGGGGGGTEEVTVGPGGNLSYDPAELTIQPGTTVVWTWDSDNHNVVPNAQPDDADWGGTEGGDSQTYNTGHEYEYTFDVEGDYEYYCTPHRQAGMTGTITVTTDTGGGGGTAEQDPEHMGVPFQAHFVGLATLLMIVVSVIYTFFVLKYGESPHTSGSNR